MRISRYDHREDDRLEHERRGSSCHDLRVEEREREHELGCPSASCPASDEAP